MVILTEDGELILDKSDGRKFAELANFQVLSGKDNWIQLAILREECIVGVVQENGFAYRWELKDKGVINLPREPFWFFPTIYKARVFHDC